MTFRVQETHQQMRCPKMNGSRSVGWGTVPHKTMNAAGLYLLLLALFILTSILNANFLARTIS